MLRGLIYIANMLDDAGHYTQADAVDSLIYKNAAAGKAVQKFIDDLKKGLSSAARSEKEFPTISEKSLADVYKVIDIVTEHGTYEESIMPRRTEFLEEWQEGVIPLVEGAIELENSIRQMVEQLEKTRDTKDVAETAELINAIEKEQERYKKILEEAEKFNIGGRPGDPEKYEKFKYLLKQKRKERGW